MKDYILILVLLLALGSESLLAQNQPAIWYFGNHAGLDFNTGDPVALTDGGINTQEGCSSVCDTLGAVLFYASGTRILNKNHQLMLNGDDLKGNSSATQSVLIVPQPESFEYFYVFTVDAIENNLSNGLCYSIVDMALDNGLGGVTSEKNILLYKKSTEKLCVTKSSNSLDYWIVTHQWESNAFYAYKLTKSGLSTTPVISNTGVIHDGSIRNAIGQMKISPQHDKLALVIESSNLINIFDFNDSTGVVSNSEVIDYAGSGRPYGVEFSPDGTKLYVDSWDPGQDLYQYDLTSLRENDSLAAPVLIHSFSGNNQIGGLQLAPNKKIYLAQRKKDFLGSINKPDLSGADCDYKNESVSLLGKTCRFGLPAYITAITFQVDFTWQPDCYGDTTLFTSSATNIDSVSWNFGDTVSGVNNVSSMLNPSHVFSAPGWFTVTLTAWTNGYSRVVKKDVLINEQPSVNLGPDTTICSNQPFSLHAGTGFDAYLWQDGSTDSLLLVDTSGVYWVTVENGCGTAMDSVAVEYKATFNFDLGPDTSFCYGNTVQLSPGGNFTSYLWQNGSTDSTLVVDAPGIYWVQVSDSTGCSATDSINVETYMVFDFSLGNDTTICEGDYIFLNGPEGYESYQWQDGSDFTSFIADTTGIYWLEVSDTANCSARDSMQLTTDKVPDDMLGTDTLFCKGSSFTLRTHPPYEQYFWQDGSSDSVFVTSETGKYWVTVFDALGCTGSDTIHLSNYPAVTLHLQQSGYLCEDDSVILQATSNFNTFLWQDSSTFSTYIARDSGTYWVKVSTPCETKSDSIIIDACSSLWIPNVFTPNNDGYNDHFGAVGKNIQKFKMVIFNRWGQELKTLHSIDEKWDGTYRGQKAAQGTYFWVADYEQVNRDGSTKHIRLQGSVTLLR